MNDSSSPMFQMIVKKLTGDMNFVGLFNIIMGALYCLTIVGALFGVPLIFMGLRLREASESLTMYLMNNDFALLERALEKQERYFFIQKVLMIIALVLIIFYIIIIIVFGAYLFNELRSAGLEGYGT